MQEKVRAPHHGKIKAKWTKHSCSKSVFDTPGIMVITSRRRGFYIPSYHQVTIQNTIQVNTKCNRFHPHTQESYHHELPLSYHTSYHTSYHSIYALFRAKVTSYHELLLIFFKKVIYIIFLSIFTVTQSDSQQWKKFSLINKKTLASNSFALAKLLFWGFDLSQKHFQSFTNFKAFHLKGQALQSTFHMREYQVVGPVEFDDGIGKSSITLPSFHFLYCQQSDTFQHIQWALYLLQKLECLYWYKHPLHNDF